MTDRGEWVLNLERKARRYSIVFVQLGSAFAPLRGDLADIKGRQMPLAEYLGQVAPNEPTLHILEDFERVAKTKDATIGRLRERVHSDVEAGHIFILVSRISRNAYEAAPGSDLLADARQVYAPLDPPVAGDHLAVLPAHRGGERDGTTLLTSCLEELGSETVHALSQALWEHGLSPNESITELRKTDLEALRGAGLVTVDESSVTWTIAGAWKKFRNAVALASSRYTVATTWLAGSFTDLWVIERAIRNAVRDALIIKQGDGWRESCLSSAMQPEILERARKDAQPSAESVKDLRDPLEWLTTVELLELREARELGNLGLETYLWTKFRHAVVPIRNRAAHMRLISAQDARTLQSWRTIVLKNLSADH
ncbi:hypothetical protein F8G81_09445 [Arthrobacter sp. CDRTa11]|uniref:hypothetical protein n=1 Tax=Arthrobacter sp. CDRTa11 TaxID=2651199 RepID=UPI002265E581|nr:hypothetical protein [Arthrobacter sp. CDRTa11]UZX02808.1 hypothetical protein F8G81_09445 [Arthrobacter sp. CDRTa11]